MARGRRESRETTRGRTRDREFTAFVEQASPELLRIGWFLTGDVHATQDLPACASISPTRRSCHDDRRGRAHPGRARCSTLPSWPPARCQRDDAGCGTCPPTPQGESGHRRRRGRPRPAGDDGVGTRRPAGVDRPGPAGLAVGLPGERVAQRPGRRHRRAGRSHHPALHRRGRDRGTRPRMSLRRPGPGTLVGPDRRRSVRGEDPTADRARAGDRAPGRRVCRPHARGRPRHRHAPAGRFPRRTPHRSR